MPAFIGKTVNGQAFPSDGTIPSDKKMWQPRLGITWDPPNDGKTVIRASGGIYYARIPGLYLASARSTNGSRGQNLYRASFLTPFLGRCRSTRTCSRRRRPARPDHPEIYIFDKDFRNPKTTSSRVGVDRAIPEDFAVSLKYNYAEDDAADPVHQHATTRCSAATGAPAFPTPGRNTNGISTLWTVESTAKSGTGA